MKDRDVQPPSAAGDPFDRLLAQALAERAAPEAVSPKTVSPDTAEHPDDDVLFDSLDGRLDDAAEERLREHFEHCPACLDRFLDLRALTPEEPGAKVADFATLAAWRAVRGSLAAPPVRARRPAPLFARLGVLRAAAAVLLLTTGLLAFTVARLTGRAETLRRALEAPQLNVPVLYLDDVRAVDAPPPRLPVGEGFAMLFLTPSEPDAFASYGAELVDGAGEIVWRGDGLVPGELGALRLGLPRRLPPGDYVLRLVGLDGAARVPLEQHPLEVR